MMTYPSEGNKGAKIELFFSLSYFFRYHYL